MVRDLVSQVLPRGTGGTPMCLKSPLAEEHNRGIEFRLFFFPADDLFRTNDFTFPFTPCDKRYVRESQFSKPQGGPHTAADVKPHGK